jgi:hypothetical protein
VQTEKQNSRNLRRELRALMKTDWLSPVVVAYQIETSPGTVEHWLKSGDTSEALDERIALFIDDHREAWKILRIASNPVRAQAVHRFLVNIASVLRELVDAPPGRRDELHAVILTEIIAASRLIEWMRETEGQTAEKVAEAMATAIRMALEPNDVMLIKRGGGTEKKRQANGD